MLLTLGLTIRDGDAFFEKNVLREIHEEIEFAMNGKLNWCVWNLIFIVKANDKGHALPSRMFALSKILSIQQ